MKQVDKQVDKQVPRCPGASVQDLLVRDGRPVPDILKTESYTFFGDDDIDYSRYTSRPFYESENEHLWTTAWQWACREEHIPEPGDFITYDIGRLSFVLLRDSNGKIRAYYNSCLHRGTKLRPSGSEGHAQHLRCPYHGWTWSLEGEISHIPCAWDFEKVTADPSGYRLPEVHVDTWGGFVFINLADEPMPLLEFLAPLPEHFANWDMADRYIELHVQKELPCNWKTAMEAFLESYHVLETHPQLLYGVSDANVQYDTFGPHISRFIAALGVASPHLSEPLSEQELVNKMLIGDRSAVTEELRVGENETARIVMARQLRKALGERYGRSLDQFSDSEIIDTIEYHVFPNTILFPGLSLPMAYRFRPLGDDHERCLFDLLFLRPTPASGVAPPPPEPIRIGIDDSYTSVDGLDAALGHVYDQDTNNLRAQQEGFKASKKLGQTLGNYQESQIRHFHHTLESYLSA